VPFSSRAWMIRVKTAVGVDVSRQKQSTAM
jgi:hypothetical protein